MLTKLAKIRKRLLNLITTLLFDVDGVLAVGDGWATEMARNYGITDEMLQQFFHDQDRPFYKCMIGQADLREEIAPYLTQWGWQHSVDDFLTYWFEQENVVDQRVLQVIAELRRRGHKCYLATNQEHYRTAYILDEMGFAPLFDGMYSSASLGIAKPEPGFFTAILADIDVSEPATVLFFDDRPDNVAAAREAGLQAEVYTGYEAFLEKVHVLLGWGAQESKEEFCEYKEETNSMQEFDREMAQRFGGFLSYKTEASPILTDYFGENPADEMDRLLDLYATPESTVLDIGCGAGQTLCRLGAKVKHIWGLDQQEDQLTATRLRADHLNLNNVTLLRGSSSNEEDMAKLPDKTFDLAFSRRGPNISAPIARSLKDNAIIVQELVSNFDAYPLGEIFGRRGYNLNSFTDQQVILSTYFNLGLFPVSCKEYFYVEYYRDIEHLDQQLNQLKAILSNWLSNYNQPPKPYDFAIDRPALELYARYNTTPKGVKLLRQRKIFVLRKTVKSPYPADALFTEIHQ